MTSHIFTLATTRTVTLQINSSQVLDKTVHVCRQYMYVMQSLVMNICICSVLKIYNEMAITSSLSYKESAFAASLLNGYQPLQ